MVRQAHQPGKGFLFALYPLPFSPLFLNVYGLVLFQIEWKILFETGL
jgi:hypothetical protein